MEYKTFTTLSDTNSYVFILTSNKKIFSQKEKQNMLSELLSELVAEWFKGWDNEWVGGWVSEWESMEASLLMNEQIFEWAVSKRASLNERASE